MRSAVNMSLCMLLCLVTLTAQSQRRKTTRGKSKARTTKTARAAKAVTPSYTTTQQVQMRKSFYLLYLLERNGPAHNVVVKDAVFNQIAKDRAARLTTAYSQCGDAACIGKALEWTADEIKEVGDEFKRLAVSNPDIAETVQRLKVVDRYPLYTENADTTFIRKAWEDAAAGLNHISRVYLQGVPPRYPRIDSISFRPADPAFVRQVKTAVQQILAAGTGNAFYRQPLLGSLKALEINGRNEATRYEPLYKDQNAAPFAKSRRTNWNAYRFSSILVPGSGPGKAGQTMDSMGMFRCKLAAEQYRNNAAPFIIVSGGHVHPYKTPFCEAIEMKKYMVGKLGIPDSAVIIEPHARHTTTNIRNAVRLAYLFNMPATKPMLIVSDSFQSLAIEKMAARFINEIGYLPYTGLERKAPTENIILPDLKAWQQDPEDPLDP
ncbi:YdcF family protein [Chitinophaga filiformis]|uniref:YdcF family protein n=1 Tax=Chitinophaga filiformis TaxID=104663 RepID=UPI001F20A497|nr:YdcF family protein [Chitinophaga filiformis]MCF6405837.1 YdcF family protein [Chitinophaga filiformis]